MSEFKSHENNKQTCLNCGHEQEVNRSNIFSYELDGNVIDYTVCVECESSYDIC